MNKIAHNLSTGGRRSAQNKIARVNMTEAMPSTKKNQGVPRQLAEQLVLDGRG